MSLNISYQEEIIPKLQKALGRKNPFSLPRLKKVVINYRVTEARDNPQALEEAREELRAIAGQQPKLCRAKISVAGFKLREGDPLALKVTLRGKRMYEFLEKLFKLVLPQVRDFRGLPSSAFDGQANYNIGLPDQTVFPEINLDKIKKVRGLQITIVSTTPSQSEAKMLLSALGLPFTKEEASA